MKNKSTKPTTLVDIVIPVYNQFDLLEQCVASIPGAFRSESYNIIVVDNGSELDGSKKFAAAHPEITFIRERENTGFPRACNKGASRKQSPLILFLNSDIVLDPLSGDILVSAMDDTSIGTAGMLLRFPVDGHIHQADTAGKVQHVGLATDIHGRFFHQFLGWSVDNPKVKKVRDVLTVTGAALITRRSLFNRLGGFELAFGLGTYEDVDYCLKCQADHQRVIVETGATAIHYTGASAIKGKVQYPIQQNESMLMAKWGGKYPWTEWQYA